MYETLDELKEEYFMCSELFDITFDVNMKGECTDLSRKVATCMSDIMQTLSYIIDEVENPKRHQKVYCRSTLMKMKKDELVDYIKCLTHNINVLYERLENQAIAFEKLLKENNSMDSSS